MRRQRGFTLIEELAVIAIIGILLAIATTVVVSAQKKARDTRRKTDLYGLSQAFEVRKVDKVCNGNQLGNYPMVAGATNNWLWTEALTSFTDCEKFSVYTPTVATDQTPNYHYYFTLTSDYQHYRLAAHLEKPDVSFNCDNENNFWVNSYAAFLPTEYICKNGAAQPAVATGTAGDYNYYTGR